MATEQSTMPVNGNYPPHQPGPYAATDNSTASQQQNNGAGYTPATQASTSSADKIPKEEVAWYFVEQYYTTLSRSPEKLWLFFNKRSTFVTGVEEEKSTVAVGQKAINQKIKELDYQDCKVRVTNVDSQGSGENIVIQVIGEMSNKASRTRKFVQTFVLAEQVQPSGYFVLNDIFRYLREEDSDREEELEASAASSGHQEPVPTAADSAAASTETVAQEPEAVEITKKLDEVAQEDNAAEEATPEVNGTPAEEPAAAPAEEPAAPAETPAPKESKAAEAETATPEAPAEKAAPAPTPAPAPKASPKPPKPAVPKTWAQLASANRAAAAAATPATPAAPAAAQPKAAAPAPAAPAAPAATQTPPAREPSPTGSQQDAGWQTAGADHSRKQSRAQAQPAVGENGRVRAYVKNVYPSVDADELKAHLAKFGELFYFDVSRQKNSAFVEFSNIAGFNAAVAANPHKFGNDNVYVEERRTPGGFAPRGGARGGRGGFEGRGQAPRTFGGGKEGPRGGGFNAPAGRGARGSGVGARGGRGAPQAA
ncbi:hypothetical protein EJ06DRAFT_538305 [Trichodelitschia bisporula]|uniref:NTF2-domain-containing protein n=1 Tax=Trichodelitschia bisporula TaxID=703511 RepID=A0A6G1HTY6_9PEZI|nr:hypothetical protein EJ06DRAFT_538305 [Trichodelitschia bisporula]